ncbi:hypothetical protein EGW08_018506 [Elysia chlorotica]|uniref:Uncharacterized protein n=1 Tax=Elysia chlorotica TaxID=188477 RepID=A0A433SWP9_ELYCH|nr:hypothetical protein EGW08_018506 [Elysia chlorotica]
MEPKIKLIKEVSPPVAVWEPYRQHFKMNCNQRQTIGGDLAEEKTESVNTRARQAYTERNQIQTDFVSNINPLPVSHSNTSAALKKDLKISCSLQSAPHVKNTICAHTPVSLTLQSSNVIPLVAVNDKPADINPLKEPKLYYYNPENSQVFSQHGRGKRLEVKKATSSGDNQKQYNVVTLEALMAALTNKKGLETGRKEIKPISQMPIVQIISSTCDSKGGGAAACKLFMAIQSKPIAGGVAAYTQNRGLRRIQSKPIVQMPGTGDSKGEVAACTENKKLGMITQRKPIVQVQGKNDSKVTAQNLFMASQKKNKRGMNPTKSRTAESLKEYYKQKVQKLKEDPEKWADFCESNRMAARRRKAKLTPEQKRYYNEKEKERRKIRRLTKPISELERQQRREHMKQLWRKRRERQTEEERERIRARGRRYYAERKRKRKMKQENETDVVLDVDPLSDSTTTVPQKEDVTVRSPCAHTPAPPMDLNISCSLTTELSSSQPSSSKVDAANKPYEGCSPKAPTYDKLKNSPTQTAKYSALYHLPTDSKSKAHVLSQLITECTYKERAAIADALVKSKLGRRNSSKFAQLLSAVEGLLPK